MISFLESKVCLSIQRCNNFSLICMLFPLISSRYFLKIRVFRAIKRDSSPSPTKQQADVLRVTQQLQVIKINQVLVYSSYLFFRYCIVFRVSKASKACLENKDTLELYKGKIIFEILVLNLIDFTTSRVLKRIFRCFLMLILG